MLEQTAELQDVGQDKKSPSQAKVTCFVCKQEVDRKQTKQIFHAREKKVWVCETHIK